MALVLPPLLASQSCNQPQSSDPNPSMYSHQLCWDLTPITSLHRSLRGKPWRPEGCWPSRRSGTFMWVFHLRGLSPFSVPRRFCTALSFRFLSEVAVTGACWRSCFSQAPEGSWVKRNLSSAGLAASARRTGDLWCWYGHEIEENPVPVGGTDDMELCFIILFKQLQNSCPLPFLCPRYKPASAQVKTV